MRSSTNCPKWCTCVLVAYNFITLYACMLVFTRQFYGVTLLKNSSDVALRDQGTAAKPYFGHRYTKGRSSALFRGDEQYWSQWKQLVFMDRGSSNAALNNSLQNAPLSRSPTRTVEIWSKTGHGLYLWEHILDGQLTSRLDGVWFYGEKTLGLIKFKFRSGHGIMPDKVPADVENLVLVLNGRSPANVLATKAWLDALPSFGGVRNVAVLLLGDERCDNDWLPSYLAGEDGRAAAIKAVFLIYDSPLIDHQHVHPWPLGVATYRGFPKRGFLDIIVPGQRKYICNFLGTAYEGSTREILLNVISKYVADGTCFVKARSKWLSDESSDSLTHYVEVLKQSDLTLCPIGLNSETYRIYEAMSMGSVPVVEDSLAPGNCRPPSPEWPSPLGLLKLQRAPVIFVRNWTELDDVLRHESLLSAQQKVRRREALVRWYAQFVARMKTSFVKVVNLAFFNESSSASDSVADAG